jgi:transposase
MALFVGLDVSLKTTSICIVEANGKLVREGKAASEAVPLIKAIAPWRKRIKLIGIGACPLSEWLYGALVECKLETVCIETRHTQRFLSSRPNKTDRSDARGIADMMRLGHFKPVHVKSRPSQLIKMARKQFVDHMLAIELSISIKGLRHQDWRRASLHICREGRSPVGGCTRAASGDRAPA